MSTFMHASPAAMWGFQGGGTDSSHQQEEGKDNIQPPVYYRESTRGKITHPAKFRNIQAPPHIQYMQIGRIQYLHP